MQIQLIGVTFTLMKGCASEPIAPQAAPVATQPAAAANGKEMYCREQLMTGSHLRKETARTAQQRSLEQLQRSPPSPPGN